MPGSQEIKGGRVQECSDSAIPNRLAIELTLKRHGKSGGLSRRSSRLISWQTQRFSPLELLYCRRITQPHFSE